MNHPGVFYRGDLFYYLLMTPNSKSIPFLPGLPGIGNLLAFKKDRLALFQRVYHELGDVGGYSLGALKFVMANRVEDVQWVLAEQHANFERSPVILLMKPVLGDGLLTADNRLNQQQRKTLNPAFAPERMADYARIVLSDTERMLSGWKAAQQIDIGHEMAQLTLGIIARSLFNADIHQESQELGQALTVLLRYTVARLNRIIPVPLSWPLPMNCKLQAAIRHLDQSVYRIIATRRNQSKEGRCPLDFLSLALRGTQGREDLRQVRDEVMTMLLAGHETTANALTWTFYLLCRHPLAYDRLLNEISSVLKGRPVTFDDLPNLPYVRQVIQESLRLYPPAYAFGRTALRPLTMNGFWVPQKTVVNISPYILHRRPDYFPDPELFDPERFAPENERKIPKFAYLPFGFGPRMCIGKQFALMEAQLALVAISQRFRLHMTSNQKIQPEAMMTLRPRVAIKLTVHELSQ